MISVIMPSYLGHYPNAASNRDMKLRRAIESFLIQGIGELIIVADGCQQTLEIAAEFNNESIRSIIIPKQSLMSGKVRQAGIAIANFDWICYLDSDDEFGPNHLTALSHAIDDSFDWFYWDDILDTKPRDCCIAPCRIGTSCIMHKKSTAAVWPDGYNHDWSFITKLGDNHKKILGAQYIVKHVPGSLDK